jgi:hypothetical protein
MEGTAIYTQKELNKMSANGIKRRFGALDGWTEHSVVSL